MTPETPHVRLHWVCDPELHAVWEITSPAKAADAKRRTAKPAAKPRRRRAGDRVPARA